MYIKDIQYISIDSQTRITNNTVSDSGVSSCWTMNAKGWCSYGISIDRVISFAYGGLMQESGGAIAAKTVNSGVINGIFENNNCPSVTPPISLLHTYTQTHTPFTPHIFFDQILVIVWI